MSSASKHVLHEAALWGAVALTGFGLFYFFDDIQRRAGPRRRHRGRHRGAARERDEVRRASRAKCG